MLTINNNTFEDWQDYFQKTFENSGRFDRKEIGIKRITYEEEYIPKDRTDLTRIKVGYFIKEGDLINLDFINPLTPGYNKLLENEYFYKYDFTPDKSYGGPGLEFNQMNLDAINKEVTEGLSGKEIKYFQRGKHVKSEIYLYPDKQNIPFTVYFDGSSLWSRIFGKMFKRTKEIDFEKEVIELKKIFRGLKNGLY